MKVMKKIISAVILCSMLSGNLIFAAPAGTQDGTYQEAINTLASLGIFSGNGEEAFQPEDAVTRAEMADIITKLLGVSGEGENVSGNTPFSDVPATHWAAKSIHLANSLNIINGFDDKRFYPDDTVTYEQAVKMIVTALGYEKVAEYQGGYPAGYLLIAAQNGILKHVSAAEGGQVTRGMVAQLVYNALEVDLLLQTSYGSEIANYRKAEGKNILTEYLHLEKGSGIVSANFDTRLVGPSKLNKGEVEIDQVVYQAGSTNAQALLGYDVTFYARENYAGDEKTILFIKPKKNNSVLKVSADDILGDDRSFSVTNMVYQSENGRKQYAKIAENADILYNGITDDTFEVNDLEPESGEITLVDHNNNGVYDVVFITSYECIVVGSVNLMDQIIYDKFDPAKSITLKDSPNDFQVTILKNGKELKLGALKEGDVLSVAESKNVSGKTKATIIVSSARIKGEATEVTDDSVVINEKKYELAGSLIQMLSEKHETIPPNKQITFYIDFQGKITAVDFSSARKRYAYLIDMGKQDGIDPTLEVKLFNAKGKVEILPCSTSLCLNGSKVKGYDDFYASLTATGREAGKIGQLVVYELNAEGQLASMDTVQKNNPKETDVLRLSLNRTNKLNYKAATRTFQGLVNIDDGTVIFAIPDDEMEEDSYRILNRNEFLNDEKIDVEAYNASEVNLAEAIIVFGQAGGTTLNTKITPAVVDKMTQAMKGDGSQAYKLSVLKDGKPASLFVSDEVRIRQLKKGDVIRYSTNAANEIESLQVLFTVDADNPKELKPVNSDNYIAQDRWIHGRVELKDGEYIKAALKTTTGEDTLETFGCQGAVFYLYDLTEERVSVISGNDINRDDVFFMRQRYGDTKEIIVYKFE